MDLLVFYQWTAIISGVVFLVQLVSSLFGFDMDLDLDSDSPDMFDTGGDSGVGNIILSFISVRNVISFLLAFSVTGYFGIRDYGFGAASFIPGCIAGIALVAFNMYLMRALARIRRDTSVEEHELEGLQGTVVFPVLAKRSGQGKVSLTVGGKVLTLFALTDSEHDLTKNTSVIVEKVMEGWVLLVCPADA